MFDFILIGIIVLFVFGLFFNDYGHEYLKEQKRLRELEKSQ